MSSTILESSHDRYRFTAASAPVTTAGAVSDIIAKLAPFAFEGMDVTLNAPLEAFIEKVILGLKFTDKSQATDEAEPFLAVVRANEVLLAARLAVARGVARLTGIETRVSLDGVALDPTWPVLVFAAGPFKPDDDTTENEHDNV
jgi:hypothetical protein